MKYSVQYGGVDATVYGYDKSEYISQYLSKGVFYEQPLLAYIASRYRGDLGSVVDVGANIGNHSVFFHDVMGVQDVTAFEPNEENYRRLKKSAPFATAYWSALSDHDGYVSSVPQPSNMGASYCKDGGDVACTSLDTFNLSPDLIKIDAENMECEVLRGALGTIKRSKPILFVEHHDIQQFYKFSRILQESGVDYVVRPFVEETWEMFEYVPVGKL